MFGDMGNPTDDARNEAFAQSSMMRQQGQQLGGMGMGGQGMGGGPLNPNDQYNLINGMAMLGQKQNNNPYGGGGNPYA